MGASLVVPAVLAGLSAISGANNQAQGSAAVDEAANTARQNYNQTAALRAQAIARMQAAQPTARDLTGIVTDPRNPYSGKSAAPVTASTVPSGMLAGQPSAPLGSQVNPLTGKPFLSFKSGGGLASLNRLAGDRGIGSLPPTDDPIEAAGLQAVESFTPGLSQAHPDLPVSPQDAQQQIQRTLSEQGAPAVAALVKHWHDEGYVGS